MRRVARWAPRRSRARAGAGPPPRRRWRARLAVAAILLILCAWYAARRLTVSTALVYRLIPPEAEVVIAAGNLGRRWLDLRDGCVGQHVLAMESMAKRRRDVEEVGPGHLTQAESWILDLFGQFAVAARLPRAAPGTGHGYLLIGRTGLRGERLSILAQALQMDADAEYSIERGEYRGVPVHRLIWEELPPELVVRYALLRGVVVFCASSTGAEIERVVDAYLDGARAPRSRVATALGQLTRQAAGRRRGAAWGVGLLQSAAGPEGLAPVAQWVWTEKATGDGIALALEFPGETPAERVGRQTALRFVPASAALALEVDHPRLERLGAWLRSELAPADGVTDEKAALNAGLVELLDRGLEGWIGKTAALAIGGWEPLWREVRLPAPVPLLVVECRDQPAAVQALFDLTSRLNRRYRWRLALSGEREGDRVLYRWQELPGGRATELTSLPCARFVDGYLVMAAHPEILEQALQLAQRDVGTMGGWWRGDGGIRGRLDACSLAEVGRHILQVLVFAANFSEEEELEPLRDWRLEEILPLVDASGCAGDLTLEADGRGVDGDGLRLRIATAPVAAPTIVEWDWPEIDEQPPGSAPWPN